MEKKAKKFVALLAKKFADAGTPYTDSEEIFTSAVSSLKEGRLKSKLQEDAEIYQKSFARQVDGFIAGPEENASDKSYTTCCQRVADRLESLTVHSPELAELTELVTKRGGNSTLDYPELQALCSLLCCRQDYGSLVNTMFLVLSSLQDKVESCQTDLDRPKCLRLQKELRMMLTFFHIKYQSLSQESNKVHASGKQNYTDVLASLISLYVDLVVLTGRSVEDARGVGKGLCSIVFLLLSRSPGHVVDVLLQISPPSPQDGATILPLARKCLKTPPVKPDNKTYSKYVACARSYLETFPEETMGIRQVAESTKAPSSYLGWLRDLDADILENFPEDRKFKGRLITRFLLYEADGAVIDTLLNILTEELPNSEETSPGALWDEQREESRSPDVHMQSDTSLFFVDTAGKNKKTAENLSPAIENLNTEVIEVDLSGFAVERGDEESEVDPGAGEDLSEDGAGDIGDDSVDEVSNESDSNDGDEASNDGDEVSNDGDEVSNDGDEVSNVGHEVRSDDVSSDGNKVSNAGDEASNAGDEDSNDGDEASNDGDEASNDGDEASNDGDEASNDGDEASNDGDDVSDVGDDVSDDGDEDSNDGDEDSNVGDVARSGDAYKGVDDVDADEGSEVSKDADNSAGHRNVVKAKVRGKTPICSKLRSSSKKSTMSHFPMTFTRLRTRSMSSVENEHVTDIKVTQKRKGPIGGILDDSLQEGGDESSACEITGGKRLRRHSGKANICSMCTEPHSDSQCQTPPKRQSRQSETDPGFSGSKKDKSTTGPETLPKTARSSVERSGGRRQSGVTTRRNVRTVKPARTLKLTKSKQYNLRRKSAL